jgi:L-gulono-1,4-lactone dehydrogenase
VPGTVDFEIGPVWRNWAREQVCHPVEIVRPRTREGLVRAVVTAREAGRRIKVAGSGHSFTDAALTEGTLLRIEALDRLLDFDRSSGLVRVEAGAVLGELNRKLDELGIALANLGDIDRQTIAGSISTGTHGTGIDFQNVSAQVEALELVGADGTATVVDPRADADGWRAARIGLGALGAIYAVTLRTVAPFTLDRRDHPLPLAETLDSLDDRVDAFDHFEFYVFPHTDTALCRESSRSDQPPRPPHPAERYAREVMLENWLSGVFTAISRHVPALGPRLARAAAASFASASKIDRSYRVFASERRIKFTEMEYGIPREHAREAVERVLEVAARPETQCVFPIEVRFVKGDDAMLSPSFERDTCYIAVHQDRKLDWPRYFRAVEGILAGYGGRPHWGKRHERTAAELAPLYPRWSDFQQVRRRLDPGGAFANGYTDRVLGPVG